MLSVSSVEHSFGSAAQGIVMRDFSAHRVVVFDVLSQFWFCGVLIHRPPSSGSVRTAPRPTFCVAYDCVTVLLTAATGIVGHVCECVGILWFCCTTVSFQLMFECVPVIACPMLVAFMVLLAAFGGSSVALHG